jgi:hypothetical protein
VDAGQTYAPRKVVQIPAYFAGKKGQVFVERLREPSNPRENVSNIHASNEAVLPVSFSHNRHFPGRPNRPNDLLTSRSWLAPTSFFVGPLNDWPPSTKFSPQALQCHWLPITTSSGLRQSGQVFGSRMRRLYHKPDLSIGPEVFKP